MSKRGLQSLDARGQRVLVRVDFNVPLDGDRITDDTRIRASAPTIRRLTSQGAKVVLASHLGRPEGRDDACSLGPVALRLAEFLGQPVAFVDDVSGEEARRAVANVRNGEVLLLQNVRYEPGETSNDGGLCERLASLADLYVNDAFGSAHRAHASTAGVAKLLPSFAGLVMQQEITALGALLDDPERPFMLVLGGAKIVGKLPVATNLLDQVNTILLGGGIANTFLAAQGFEVGHSLCEQTQLQVARDFLARAKSGGTNVLLPADVVVAWNKDGAGAEICAADAVPADKAIYDIGPETRTRYAETLAGAKTVFWNGPMGLFELPSFAEGTIAIARALADLDGMTIAGGGDSVAAIEQQGLGGRFSHISTGGGASLEFLSGADLPGIAALPDA